MKLRIKICIFLLLSACSYSFGQIEQYNYKRELKGITGQWHKISLPDDIFGKVSQNLSDIRIYGITQKNDTVEAPYILRLMTEKISSKEVAFKILNVSHNENGYYFTIEIPTIEAINQIELEFRQQNFDWRLKLEGSQTQKEWFTVIENYRILSIKNELTDFQYTKLTFPVSKYRFFRLLIDSEEKPHLTTASIAQREITDGTFRDYPIKQMNINENKQARQTEVDIEFQIPVPVSHIKIKIKDTFDYYRPMTVKYLVDSLKTEQGWKYNYNTMTSGILNSLEENEYKIGSKTVQKLKILIHNKDNQPLTVDTIKIKGYVSEILARFMEPATYFLTYGNRNAANPHYDIDRFTDKIPKTLTTLKLEDEQIIEKEKIPKTDPLFKNKFWLWIIMAVIILTLGWFSVKMIGKN